METVERLQGYYKNFSDATLQAVADVAEMQLRAGPDYRNVLNAMGVPQPTWHRYGGYKPVRVLDIVPQGAHAADYDPEHARVMHTGMGNDLDPNNIYQIATIAAVDPTKRLIAFGNPGTYFKSSTGKLNHRQRRDVVKGPPETRADNVYRGDLRPTVEPGLIYLHNQGIRTVEQAGFSFGADKALTASEYAHIYGQDPVRTLAIEPATFVIWGVAGLMKAFNEAGKALEGYVEASHDPAFFDARQHSPNLLTYGIGLSRLTNMAIGKYLASGGFQHRALSFLDENSNAKLTVARGSDSELATYTTAGAAMEYLAYMHKGRVRDLVLPGQKHNIVNDIHLQAALVREAFASA